MTIYLIFMALFVAFCLALIAINLAASRWWKGQAALYPVDYAAAEARRAARPWYVRLTSPGLPE